MGYIIVWRSTHREPHVQTDTHDFKDEYSTLEDAKKAAIEIERQENESGQSKWYFDYEIFESCD